MFASLHQKETKQEQRKTSFHFLQSLLALTKSLKNRRQIDAPTFSSKS